MAQVTEYRGHAFNAAHSFATLGRMLTPPTKLDPDTTALFLDVDGTLLDIQQHPGDVAADADLIEKLEQGFNQLSGALALITGRALVDVDRMFSPARFPVAGAHGAELRLQRDAAGDSHVEPMPSDAMAMLISFAEEHQGLLLERKHGGASLHFRRAPELEAACKACVDAVLSRLGSNYRLIAGKMVFEIAPSTHHKGAAIESFLDNPPFFGRRPVFLGDDVTDEDGFRVVNARRGISILVGEQRPTEARYYLPDTAAVRTWIRSALSS